MKICIGKKPCSGSSLGEVLTAIGILGVAATALVLAFNFGFFAMQWVRENQRATQILLHKAEILRLYRWDQVNETGFLPPTVTEYFNPQMPAGQQGIAYICNLQVLPFPYATTYQNNLRQLTITLTWTNTSRNIARTRSLTTYVAEDGIQNYVY